jgi:hypothetical protein
VADSLVFFDDDHFELMLDEQEANDLLELTGGLEAATVSACPRCRSRVLACVALVDVIDGAPPHPRGAELSVLAEEAPTLHLYCYDVGVKCTHAGWHDPGYAEWIDATEGMAGEPRDPR